MLEGFEDKEKYGLALGFAVAVVASFAAGSVTGNGAITGAFSADNPASSDAVKQEVQSFMDQQLQRQRQQFSTIANRNPNITEQDLSMEATVTDVSSSQFGSLQKATVSITGTVPARTGGTRSLDQEQTYFVSSDGRYLFQQPTDLQQQRQTSRQAPTRPPTGGSGQ